MPLDLSNLPAGAKTPKATEEGRTPVTITLPPPLMAKVQQLRRTTPSGKMETFSHTVGRLLEVALATLEVFTIEDAAWDPVANVLRMKCPYCERTFPHPSNRWIIECPGCGRTGDLRVSREAYANKGRPPRMAQPKE